MIPLVLIGAALAGSVYINGVRADLPPEMTLKNVTVRFDADGNVWVDAPQYKVEVIPPTGYTAPSTYTPPVAYAPPVNTPPAYTPPVASSMPMVIPPGDDRRAATQGQWWLVTEDDGSAGQVLEVRVNGTLVRRVSSGEPQVILDVGPFLRPGANTVSVTPSGAGPGQLNVYIGRGTNLSGTIHLDNPDVRYVRRPTDSGGARQFTLNVP